MSRNTVPPNPTLDAATTHGASAATITHGRFDTPTATITHAASGSATPTAKPAARAISLGRDLLELTKPRITTMAVISVAAGYYVGARGPIVFLPATRVLLAATLLASGASALNQWFEAETDRLMARTANRPLPQGRLVPTPALLFGLVLAASGVALMYAAGGPLAASIGLITVLLYVGCYTPLKRVTPLCTVIGAVPGALPPLMGWAAGAGDLSAEAWLLFAILFLWQMPHFLAIAWMYRDDYARAGQPMLPVVEPSGGSTARQAVLYAAALLPTSLLPTLLGVAGEPYFAIALTLGLFLLTATLVFASRRETNDARRLLHVSVIYLPLLLGALVLTRQSF